MYRIKVDGDLENCSKKSNPKPMIFQDVKRQKKFKTTLHFDQKTVKTTLYFDQKSHKTSLYSIQKVLYLTSKNSNTNER